MRNRRAVAAVAATLAAVLAAGPAAAFEPLQVGTAGLKDAKLRLYGFVETDAIYDTTQSFTEEPDNATVLKRSVIGGQRGRDMLSIRNSRLGGELTLAPTDSGVNTKAVFELDFMGNQGPNTTPGNTPGAQSERDYLNNPTVRVRHAYVDVSKGELGVKLGQYWSLLGWQPYYFPGEAIVMPAAGQLYRRFAQVRAADTHPFGDWTLETAADAAKPAEMNSGSPEWHAGARLASTKYKGASLSGAGSSMVGLSAGVSAALIPTRTANIGSATGNAVAVDFLIPVIPSADGKSRDNTLIWAGEGYAGSGIGGLELAGLTLGIPGVSASTPGNDGAIDSGIAGLDTTGNAQLLHVRGFRTHVQYSLAKYAASAGYAQVEGRNLDRFGAADSAAAFAIAPKLQYGYVSVMYDPASWLRFAAEVNQTRTTYNDPGNRFARNNRYQASAYFYF